MAAELKVDVVRDIAQMIGIEAPHMSTGSTEPRALFDAVNTVLGLGLPTRLTKPEIAQAIVEAAGYSWGPTCESRGGTVTLTGLAEVRRAVALLTGTGERGF
jgi:hypothetical protein